MDQVDVVFDDQPPDQARCLGYGERRRDLERGADVRRSSTLQLIDEVAARRDHPHGVATVLQLAGKADHDAFQPAHAHRFRGEQNPHRPRRL